MDELSLRMDIAVSQPQRIFFDNTKPLKLGAHKRVDRALTNLRGTRLKRKGKEVLGARETRGPGRTRREGKKRRFLLSLLARPSRFSRA